MHIKSFSHDTSKAHISLHISAHLFFHFKGKISFFMYSHFRSSSSSPSPKHFNDIHHYTYVVKILTSCSWNFISNFFLQLYLFLASHSSLLFSWFLIFFFMWNTKVHKTPTNLISITCIEKIILIVEFVEYLCST